MWAMRLLTASCALDDLIAHVLEIYSPMDNEGDNDIETGNDYSSESCSDDALICVTIELMCFCALEP